MNAISANYAKYKKRLGNLRQYYEKGSVASTLAVVLSLFLISFFIVVALRPTLVKIAELRNNIEEAEQTLTKLESKVQSLERASQIWNEINVFLPYLQNSIPIEPEYRSLYKEMEALAIREGVVFMGGSYGSTIVGSRIAFPYEENIDMEGLVISYNINIEGEYPDLIKYLKAIVNLDRVLSVNNIAFTNATGENGETINLTVSGDAHYFARVDVVNSILGAK